MRYLLTLCLLFAPLATRAATLVTAPWLSATNSAQARAALGISETNAIGVYVTNTFTNFNITAAVIGTGSNAVTLTPTNGGVETLAPWTVGSVNSAGDVSAPAFVLNGTRITAWPSGGTNGIVNNAGNIEIEVAYSTNLAAVSGLTNLGWFTNGYYAATWTSTNGDALSLESSTDGASWATASASTNGQYLRIVVELATLAGGTPGVSDLVIYSIVPGGGYGGTNDFRTTTVLADSPASPDQVATKQYVDEAAVPRSWSLYSATGPVRLGGHSLDLGSAWSMVVVVNVSNELRCALQFGGTTVMELSPGFIALTNASIATNLAFTRLLVPTNTPGPFRVLASTNSMTTWREVAVTNSYPTAIGNSYEITFPRNTEPGAWLFTVGRSNAPAVHLPAATY